VQPRSNSSLTRTVMAICRHLAKTMVPHRASFLLLAALLIPTTVIAADFSGPVASVLDGDTLEVLHNHHPECIRLPQSQRHQKERRDPLYRQNGEAHILGVPSFVIWPKQNRSPQQHEHAD